MEEGKIYTLEEREKQLQDLIQINRRLENEKFILEMKLDVAEEYQEGKLVDLQKDNDLLKEELAILKEELQRLKMSKVSVELSEKALKEINEELSMENEELKRKLRETERSLPVELTVNVNEDLNEKNCELAMVNKCLRERNRETNWAFSMIENHLQMIGAITNRAREGNVN